MTGVLKQSVTLYVDVDVAKRGQVAMVEGVVLEVAEANDVEVEFADVEEFAQEPRAQRGAN
jgi:hypothetical protein